jgi:tRNA (guanine-N7-)-methyltransferase
MTVRKSRRLTREELAPYLLELPGARPNRRADEPSPTAPRPIDWRQLFGNDHPVEVEVGFGKGPFLLNAGLSRPDRNFFGVEVVRKYQLYAAERVAVRGLPNVKTCCADAKVILRDYVAAGSVEDVHVYFPDPWWKTRHKKRLLFRQPAPGAGDPRHDMDYLTNFERKFRKEGRPIHRALYEKAD